MRGSMHIHKLSIQSFLNFKNIINTFCDNNHWQIIWDSGVTDSAL